MTDLLRAILVGVMLIGVLTGHVTAASTCGDIDTTACSLFAKQDPDLCSKPAFADSACKRFCGLCPLECYSCPSPVTNPDDCNTTTLCPQNQTCMLKHLRADDGHDEYIMSCEDKQRQKIVFVIISESSESKFKVCQGAGFGFNIVGKRSTEKRHIDIDCCDMDLCNTATKCSKDIVFLLDDSGSVGHTNFAIVLDFVREVTSQLEVSPVKAQVACVTYSSIAKVNWYLNAYHSTSDVVNAVNNIKYVSGGTRTDLAIHKIRTDVLTVAKGDRPANKNVVIVLTDGQSNKKQDTLNEAAQLHKVSDDIISIGIGSRTGTSELVAIATDSHHVIDVHGFRNLTSIVPQIISLICM